MKIFLGIILGFIIFAVLNLTVFRSDFIKQDSCLDGGGIWDSDKKICWCSRTVRGYYDDAPSAEQQDMAKWCEGRVRLERHTS